MLTRVAASILTAMVLAGCASAPLDELPQSDEDLAGLVQEALSRDPDLIGTTIKADAINGTVTLHGWVDFDRQRQRATFIAQGVKGVRSVINNIHLK
jgi:osmotically-inducible protein OsmY